MTDVLIRGWDVPKGCDSCQLNKDGRGCPITGTQYEGDTWVMMDFDEHTERLPDCPLHELPEHGDLIDRDALKHKFCTHCDGYEYDTGACVDGDQDCMDAKIIMTAPVIVPANKEETE